jgi:hypothetical protein
MVLAALVTGVVWTTAPTARAAGESFKVISVDTTGCDSGNFGMTVERANLDGGSYTVRTVASAAGLIYMNEAASISVNGLSGWNIFNNFTYGAVPNPGTMPIPQNKQLRIDFTLERPMGTVLFGWTVVVDGCNTGNILYNLRTSRDKDKDLVPTPQDKCPTLRATRPNGCPLRERSLTMAYDRQGDEFFGWLFAEGRAKLHSRRPVTIWKVRPGADKRVGQVTTSSVGFYHFAWNGQTGVYYGTSPAVIVASAGQALKDTSLNVRVR